ncbi:MAG: hypothetical protein JRH19_22650 [Deltaproteobacteria bacterium]|nr:hypothetical protein [Deltaproteobacteria bacterium]
MPSSIAVKHLAALAALALLALPTSALADYLNGDEDLLGPGSIPPNVLLGFDSSGSMHQVLWPPYYDLAEVDAACSGLGSEEVTEDTGGFVDINDDYTCMDGVTTAKRGYVRFNLCGRERDLWVDPEQYCSVYLGTGDVSDLQYKKYFLRWYFSAAGDAHYLGHGNNTSTDPNYVNSTRSYTDPYDNSQHPKWAMSRMTAAKKIARNLIFQTNSDCAPGTGPTCTSFTDRVRFGIGKFSTYGSYNKGGFVTVGIDDYSNNQTALNTHLSYMASTGGTPMSKSVFRWYTYFMQRDASKTALGKNGSTRFPVYQYRQLDGSAPQGWHGTADAAWKSSGPTASDVPPCPVDEACQKNFIIFFADGASKKDTFTLEGGTDTEGFSDFTSKLIGDYYSPGDENEVGCDSQPDPFSCSDRGSRYLDDIGYFMNTRDFDPDLAGDQTIDLYTVGIGLDGDLSDTSQLANGAQRGGGTAYTAEDADDLEKSLQAAFTDIIEKSQVSFSPAAVPSSRLGDGAYIYNSYFSPSSGESIWPGEIEVLRLMPDGSIVDKNGDLAVNKTTGEMIETRVPFWEAGKKLKTNTSRTIWTHDFASTRKAFDYATMTNANLGLTGLYDRYPGYPNAGAPHAFPTTLDGIRAGVINYIHGKDGFDEDMDGDITEMRQNVLGDSFHSGMKIIGPPSTLYLDEPSFKTFYDDHYDRDRVLYVGANDGLMHAFDAGTYTVGDDSMTATVESEYYTAGTGEEVFGWVSQPGRSKLIAQNGWYAQNGLARVLSSDNTPVIADAWLGDGSGSDTTKSAAEWATVLIHSSGHGDNRLTALDISDPDATSCQAPATGTGYPCFLWDFAGHGLNRTFSKPVITRVKLRSATATGDTCGADDGDGDCREQWVAIIGGGWLNVWDPNFSGFRDPSHAGWNVNAKTVLMIALDSGTVVGKFAYDATDRPTMIYAIPSEPAVIDTDNDGFSDVVYVGDTGGQVWKWDISNVGEDTAGDSDVDNWESGLFFSTAPVTLTSGDPHHRSFWFAPQASWYKGELYLAFASGERRDMLYEGDTSVADDENRFYFVADPNPTGASAFPGALDDSDLTDITSKVTDDDLTDSGYYFELEDSDKFVTDITIFANHALVGSYKPLTTADCEAPTGRGDLYVFDLFSGKGFYPDAMATPMEERHKYIDEGVPSTPTVLLADDPKDDKIVIKSSDGPKIFTWDAPVRDNDGVGFIYWREVK